MLNDRPGDREPVIGAGAAADLIQDEQAARSGVVENIGSLEHFHHEGRLPLVDGILRPDAGENPVHQANFRLVGRHKTANLRHQHDQYHLPKVG